MLECLISVDDGHLHQFLHIFCCSALVLRLQLAQLLVGRVQSDSELDVLQDGSLGVHKLLQGVLFFGEDVELADGDGVDLVELGGGQQDRSSHQLVVLVGEHQALLQQLVQQSQGQEERAPAELEVALSPIQPLHHGASEGDGGEGTGEGEGLGAGLGEGVLAAGRDVADVLYEGGAHCLHFRFFELWIKSKESYLHQLRILQNSPSFAVFF